jgi:3-methyl-2-oxobutanoate hydroxymethyltransferase
MDLTPSQKLARFAALKPAGKKITSLTAADYPTAKLLDEAGLDLILVGDSLGMVVLGYPDTVDVTIDDMLHHTRAVRRGVKKTLLGADLPYHTYQTTATGLHTARALVLAGAEAVKLEGGVEQLPKIQAIIRAGIPLIGHIGMLPQSVREEGGYKKKGKTPADAERLMADAVALDNAGVIAIVLEGVVAEVAEQISKQVKCPTIGIGAGKGTDGQILVTHDLIGAFPWFCPPFAKPQGDVAGEIRKAVAGYVAEVRS